jgi:GAF domain-containing protein
MTTSEATRLAEELAAIGRVGALVAADAPPAAVFESVTAQVGQLVGADAAAMVRVETDSEVTCLGFWTKDGGYQAVGQRRRVASPSGVEGTVGDFLREQGWRASVGAPVVLEGRMWGILAVGSTAKDTLPEDTDTRLAKFSELVGTAVSNAKRGEDLALLDREQASLRRVVTLVAAESSPAEVFDAVTREAAQVLETEAIGMLRFEADGSATLVAQSETPWDPPPLGRASPSRSERDRRGCVERVGPPASTAGPTAPGASPAWRTPSASARASRCR